MAVTNPIRCYFQTLEPVHIGTGGYRLGRVDKTICREPGTNLPKVPGTSLSGAARAYAADLCGRPWAAGAAQIDLSATQRKDKDCPIFYTFGNASDEGGGNAGVVSFGDAYVLLFPVYSLAGQVWITCPRVLRQAGFDPGMKPNCDEIAVEKDAIDTTKGLNLASFWFKDDIGNWEMAQDLCEALSGLSVSPLVLVSDLFFAPLVNCNLEVRTSVAIDPEKGIAAKGKLFSYEAIPRATILFSDLIIDDYRHSFPGAKETDPARFPTWRSAACPWTAPEQVAIAGLRRMALFGIGGMGTRGFGRLKLEKPETEIPA